MAAPGYGLTKRLSSAKANEYSINSQFRLGYRNREDVTNLPPGVLIVGSQNVLTNVSDRVQIRQGYTLDGLVNYVNAPVLASFDWLTRGNGERHIRVGNLTSTEASDGKMQYRYVAVGGELGDNVIINGEFDGNADGWNFYTGSADNGALPGGNWAYDSDDALHTVGDTDAIGQQAALSPITPYHVKFDVSGSTGSVDIMLNDTVVDTVAAGGSVDAAYTSGEYTGGYDGLFLIVPTTDFNGAISAVSVNQILPEGYVYWKNLLTGLGTTAYNFTTFWSITESLRLMLFVNGTSNIFSWNGAYGVVDIAGSSSNELKLAGGGTWLEAGFNTTDNLFLEINGHTYEYSGGVDSDTLTGVSPDPTEEPEGSIVQQAVQTIANTDMTDIPDAFPNGLISTLNNQVFVGALTSPAVYISIVNDYTDYSSSDPRQTGEGGVLILDDNCVAFDPQEQYMYVTCGQDLWYNINFELQTSTVGVTYEQVNALRLKTGRRQAAISQAYVSHMKNNIIVVTQETTIDTFGRVESSLATPQTVNISDPIKLDIDNYDFTDGSIAYWRFYILVAVPKEGIVRIFNLNTNNWEAPQTLPISRFYIVDGELYGHSYATFESYKLFTGYADRVDVGFTGFPIQAVWRFSFENYGSRFSYKRATKAYVEGYINSNTILNMVITYELDGCKTIKEFEMRGDDAQFVCLPGSGGGSLGKVPFGKMKLGGDQPAPINNLPPKFRWFPTFSNTDFFENSVSFSVLGTDERMELLAFGLAVGPSTQIPTAKMD